MTNAATINSSSSAPSLLRSSVRVGTTSSPLGETLGDWQHCSMAVEEWCLYIKKSPGSGGTSASSRTLVCMANDAMEAELGLGEDGFYDGDCS